MNKDGFYLLVDMDDLLVFSAPLLQRQVDIKTNYKTDTLEMLEQLNRNCIYYYKKVQEECLNAQESKRFPNLQQFMNFDDIIDEISKTKYDELTEYEKDLLYQRPVRLAKNYCFVANQILNQFLEERDTFLEIDNMPKGSIINFNYSKELELIAHYVDIINDNKDALDKINHFCNKDIRRIISEAKGKNIGNTLTIPEFGDLVKIDHNDVIKTTQLSINSSQERILYKKPIEDLEKCMMNLHRINDIIKNSNFIISPSKELIDYKSIYQKEHVNMHAVRLVRDIMNSGLITYGTIATHQTGDREDFYKRRLKNKILPELGYESMRFHSMKHDVARRGRSSKIDIITKRLGIRPEQVILIDDSMANCADCNSKGGFAILYKPYTDSEIINKRLEDLGMVRITEFNSEEVLEIINEHIMQMGGKQKKIGEKYE